MFNFFDKSKDNLRKYSHYGLATLKEVFGTKRNWTGHEAAPGHGVSERVIVSIHDPYQNLRHLEVAT